MTWAGSVPSADPSASRRVRDAVRIVLRIHTSDGFASFGGGDCAQCVCRFVPADGEVFRLQISWSSAMLGNLPEDLLMQLSEVHRDRLAQQASTGRFVGVEQGE